MVDLGIDGVADAEKIGQGGFAVVYKARQPAYQREVAVKVLSTDIDETTLARFQREIAAMGQLGEHPGIVALYEAGTTERGRPYILMPYLSGGSLQDALDGGLTYSPREAADTLTRLAGALAAAHDEGVLHRDIKPANVLLGRFGDPMLADFGIARIAGGHETTSGVITASIAHAAPEILDGRPPSVASDLYGLASTIYNLMAGKAAFTSPSDQSLVPLLSRTMTAEVPPIEGLNEAGNQVLRRAMAKSPADRYSSASALAAAFADAVDGKMPEIRATVSPVAERARATSVLPGGPPPVPADDAEPAPAGDLPSADPPAPTSNRPSPTAVIGVVIGIAILAFAAGFVLTQDDGQRLPPRGGTGVDQATEEQADDEQGADTATAEPTADSGATELVDEIDDDAGDAAQDEALALGLDVEEAAQLGPIEPGPPPLNPQLNGGLDGPTVMRMDSPTDTIPITLGELTTVQVGGDDAPRLTFDVEPGSVIRVQTFSASGDPAVAVFDDQQRFLIADDDSGFGETGADVLLDLVLPPGGPHSVALVNLDAEPVDVSVLVTADDADPLRVGTTFTDLIEAPHVPGVYSFTSAPNSPPPSGIRATSDAFDASLRIIDDRGRVVADARGGAGADVDTSELSTGTYYVMVSEDDGGATGQYTLDVR